MFQFQLDEIARRCSGDLSRDTARMMGKALAFVPHNTLSSLSTSDLEDREIQANLKNGLKSMKKSRKLGINAKSFSLASKVSDVLLLVLDHIRSAL